MVTNSQSVESSTIMLSCEVVDTDTHYKSTFTVIMIIMMIIIMIMIMMMIYKYLQVVSGF